MSVKNRTLQNKSKQPRLSSSFIIPTHHVDGNEVVTFLQSIDPLEHPKEQVLFSIGLELIQEYENPAIRDFLSDYSYEPIELPELPTGAFDLLGSTYQFLNSKTENLEKGSFYTGKAIALDMVADLDFTNGQTILDPACGSGSFLFHSDAGPDQIFGVDFDPIAVMIAKFNFFIKFPEAGSPNIYCEDFFTWISKRPDAQFDYVIGNPPYGANIDISHIFGSQITSGESFSFFVESGFNSLSPEGTLRFLVPESLLNVKKHRDVRNFILNNCNLSRIKRYQQKFSGVMSDVYLIELNKSISGITEFEDVEHSVIPTKIFKELNNQVFAHLKDEDISIIEHVNEIRALDLSESIFGLGVVTGDNKSKIFTEKAPGLEPIFSGKELAKYKLMEPKLFIHFDRNQLQQVAPDEIYRAPKKLVYKTISKKLIFALDSTGSLTSNSANILIPQMPGYSIETVMALLNSDLYSFLHLKLFGGVNKIARTNLESLPFPRITEEQNSEIQTRILKASQHDDIILQRYIHEEIFSLNSSQIRHIMNSL